MLQKLILAALAASLIPIACPADSLTVQFNISCCVNSGQYFTSPDGGSLTLNLLPNGEIGANVQSNGGNIIALGFGGSSAVNHDFLPITPDFPVSSPATSDFGQFSNGFVCALTACAQQESFLIGNPGQFSSVYQLASVIGGGVDSNNPAKVNFFLEVTPGGEAFQFGADVPQIPEPATCGLLLSAGAALCVARAKKSRFLPWSRVRKDK